MKGGGVKYGMWQKVLNTFSGQARRTANIRLNIQHVTQAHSQRAPYALPWRTPYLVVHVCFVCIHLQRDTGLLELLYVAALVFGLQTTSTPDAGKCLGLSMLASLFDLSL